ncbi:DUF1917-domain-containing protein [Aulographum hederae CBS 113979]|uniref:DUF1917-domain-containing protein n=1 Tax=Aulographum hederae CBS 113979 TaxID=1176131 RepID=A0A6G1GU62_9PEZI|nr:DUF1917-domain-containing protein [Aulographum hederae CBS 113979]
MGILVEEEQMTADGYISEESSFYGDDEERHHLNARSEAFRPQKYWTSHAKQINSIAYNERAQHVTVVDVPHVELHNIYEGQEAARQLHEPIHAFLKRLPPLDSRHIGPWIWIANPYPSQDKGKGKYNQQAFMIAAEQGLADYMSKKRSLEEGNPEILPGTLTRKLRPARDQMKDEILRLAVENGVTSGKWMLFPKMDDIHRVWRLVCEGVAENRLGTGAKFATGSDRPDRGRGPPVRLICVYTKDFSDRNDVRRVVEELAEMALVPRDASRGIYYKCDAYTHLGIESDNPYHLPASIYSSKDILDAAKAVKWKG